MAAPVRWQLWPAQTLAGHLAGPKMARLKREVLRLQWDS